MNVLAKIKLNNNYDLVVESLYKVVTNEETGEETQEPITDVEGMTALLTTDGTSWEFVENSWKQIDENIDRTILYSLYPFLMSVCNSIHNDFVNCCYSKFYQDVTLEKRDDNEEIIDIKNLLGGINVAPNDFVILKTCVNDYLSNVLEVTDDTVSIDGRGLGVRTVGRAETVGLFLVSFPPQFIDAALSMLSFDLFSREDKEKRQERLGNYTYTNFEPTNYYGLGAYPQYIEDTVKYFQKIHL